MVHKEFIRWFWDVQTPSPLPQCSKAQADPELAPRVRPLIICVSVSSFGTHQKAETNADFEEDLLHCIRLISDTARHKEQSLGHHCCGLSVLSPKVS